MPPFRNEIDYITNFTNVKHLFCASGKTRQGLVLCGGIFAYLDTAYGYFDPIEYFEDSLWATIGLIGTFAALIICLMAGAVSTSRNKMINNAIKEMEKK